ncbi:MAG: gliding motility-associated C-terminal domain-containing protein [Fluviicola sp.]
MLEKDQFEQFLSDSFAKQTESVRPDLWSGVQAKMVSAGVTSTIAAKSVSILTKWILGSIAVGSATTISAVILFNNNETPKTEDLTPSPSKNIEYNSETENKNNSTKNEFVTTSKNSDQRENMNLLISEKSNLIETTILSMTHVVETIEEETALITENSSEKSNSGEQEGVSEINQVGTNDINETEVTNNDVSSEQENVKEENPVIKSKVTKFPDVFTPNGDGANDFYSIEIQNINNFRVMIMDVNNKIVFESTDPNFKWDGSVRNEIQKSGQFACIVTGIDNEGKNFKDIQLFVIQ